MRKLKAAFFDGGKIDYVYSPAQQKQLAEITDLMPERITKENIDSLDLSEVQAIISTWGQICFSEEQLNRMPKLEALFYAAGATDAFARPLLNRGIKVISGWKANAIPVAEFTFAQIILAMKNYFSASRSIHSKADWNQKKAGPGCYGETVALLGAGAISSHVQELLRSCNLNVIVVPSRKERRTISLEEVFRTAYVISNHFPNREDNKKVLTKEMFESMRPNATFINTGRGAQVDEAGLIEVLKRRPDLTVLLDVTFPEPPDEGSELYTLPNVHLTPHIAGSLNDEVHRMADYVIGDYIRHVSGEPLQNEVTEQILMTH